MRIKNEQVLFLKKSITRYLPGAGVYLMGSRVDDKRKGGDIDILVIGENKLSLHEKRKIKLTFCKKFGEQKIDIISFRKDDPSNFKALSLIDGVEL